MKHIKHILFSAALTLLPSWALAQTDLSGQVTDVTTGETLIGATILVKGDATQGTVTDAEGRFSLHTSRNTPLTLTIGYAGYRSQDIVVYDAEEPLTVQLRTASDFLKEVVVVGYGTQSRTQLTGSVVTVKADVFANSTAVSLDGALGGQVAGLNVTAASGQPGAESSIRIRGGNSVNASNEPLYVVDGFIYFKDAANSGTGIGAIESG